MNEVKKRVWAILQREEEKCREAIAEARARAEAEEMERQHKGAPIDDSPIEP